jgi:hypothetical protein
MELIKELTKDAIGAGLVVVLLWLFAIDLLLSSKYYPSEIRIKLKDLQLRIWLDIYFAGAILQKIWRQTLAIVIIFFSFFLIMETYFK